MIRITSKKDGFRRCGVAHPKVATDHPDGRFSKKQLGLLKSEPMLVVEEVADSPGKNTRPNVGDTVALVQAAETLEALAELEEGEDRKGVLDALAKKRNELSPA